MPITIYPGSMKKRNANGSYSDLVPAIATDPEVLDDFAEEYSTSETYNIGDYCIHNSDLYKCNTNNTTGTWNNNAWDRVTVADELVDHKNTLNNLDSDDVANASTNVSGATVSEALDNLKAFSDTRTFAVTASSAATLNSVTCKKTGNIRSISCDFTTSASITNSNEKILEIPVNDRPSFTINGVAICKYSDDGVVPTANIYVTNSGDLKVYGTLPADRYVAYVIYVVD